MNNCPNCGVALQGPFCFQCGQEQKQNGRFFLSLVSDAFEDVFAPNSRTRKTLFSLLFRPGHLTNEYAAGRRARYLPPLRLYLLTSFFLFLFLSVSDLVEGPAGQVAATGAGAATLAPAAPPGSQLDTGNSVDDLDKFITETGLPMLSESADKSVRERLRTQAMKVRHLPQDDPGELKAIVLNVIPPIMFLLLPLFAVMMKLVYVRTGRYYSEHLIFALHSHAFIYLAVLVLQLIQLAADLPFAVVLVDWGTFAICLWIPLYLYLSLKRRFSEGRAMTLFKFVLLTLLYFILWVIMIPLAMIWGFLTL